MAKAKIVGRVDGKTMFTDWAIGTGKYSDLINEFEQTVESKCQQLGDALSEEFHKEVKETAGAFLKEMVLEGSTWADIGYKSKRPAILIYYAGMDSEHAEFHHEIDLDKLLEEATDLDTAVKAEILRCLERAVERLRGS